MTRNIYLNNVSVEEAKKKWYSALELKRATEKIDIRDALDRITAEPIVAKVSAPHYHASAMDGIAVKAEKTAGASEKNPIKLEKDKDYQMIDTGDPIPEVFNAVIMIEDVNRISEEIVEIEKGATPWQHVRTVGESLVKGELILPANHQISPYDIGLVLDGGVIEVKVYSQPQVQIIPTGTELVEPGASLKPGNIIEFNSQVLAKLVQKWGGKAVRKKIIPDNYQEIKAEVSRAVAEMDLVVVTAGSSAGSEDYTAQILAELGEVFVHGVSMKPGGPVILARIGNTPVIGVPGYPVAAALTFRLFARSVIYKLAGKVEEEEDRKVKAKIVSKVLSSLGFREFLRVKLSELDGEVVATPLARSSGVMGSLVEADGLVAISEFSEGLNSKEEVEVELLKDRVRAEKTLLSAGSNDLTLDILKDELAGTGFDFITKSTGSLGGLTALKRRETHLAGTHLLDPETGEYNFSYLKNLFKNREIMLVNLVYREQGLMFRKDNSKKIQGFEDLAKEDLLFINRQRGAGTRVLLDYMLKEKGINPEQINGYDRIEYTHMTLAAAIASGGADTGLGILAAAQAFDLDFIPIAKERYDLAIPREYWEDERIQVLLKVLRSDEFKERVNKLSGYDTSKTGQVIKHE
ncbi:molybdopterin biosynthesis protein [Iocasia frigidifontis]|uniref:Molybdopterin molybdenumtransferase n=1 Tax=Iocasia fonsfrigidae TaxID=2682810 RepID=A0A8A7KGP0_9FIRM|nr:molybdopterin biosynthesis protein [Iocasia fonsfrigidae]QTL98898.1 molybdopterin biosynthesis protein [Iocasia fonsfrigidae]